MSGCDECNLASYFKEAKILKLKKKMDFQFVIKCIEFTSYHYVTNLKFTCLSIVKQYDPQFSF